VYLNLKDYAKAEESFNEALKLAPNFSEAYNNLGLLNLLQGRYQQAISYFEKALANPLYANAHSAKTNMAQAYYLLGDKNKAIEILTSLLKERADYAQALIELGKIYLNERDLQAAEFYFKQALKLDRTSSEARYYLGEVFFQQGKFDLAKELWESLIQIRPDSPWSSLAREKVFFLERLKTQKP
jgi:type IV pilus assembly protein PilF